MTVWNWQFKGYQNLAGSKPVQDWFTTLPDQDAKNDARDTFGGLQVLPNHLWRRPEFDQLTDGISEVRFDGKAGTYRFYGYFGPTGERQVYTLLHGAIKKKRRDRDAQGLAARRRNQIEREGATAHEFEFYERTHTTTKSGAGRQSAVRGITTGQIYRFPNSGTQGSGGNEPDGTS
jgi:hypothetical protein